MGQLRADNAADYATTIRAHLIGHNGHPKRSYDPIYDHQSREDGSDANTIWSPAAQLRLHSDSDEKPADPISLESQVGNKFGPDLKLKDIIAAENSHPAAPTGSGSACPTGKTLVKARGLHEIA